MRWTDVNGVASSKDFSHAYTHYTTQSHIHATYKVSLHLVQRQSMLRHSFSLMTHAVIKAGVSLVNSFDMAHLSFHTERLPVLLAAHVQVSWYLADSPTLNRITFITNET